ncbi:MAG: YCF48-related protein, partial [Ignavibacteria bacterium]|nr:YCF48-related protein [Ignavibacteria bacterium]
VYFIDNLTGWISEMSTLQTDSKLYKTMDGGYSWTLQYSSSENIFMVEFVNQDVGWAISGKNAMETNYGTILKTTNGGSDWDVQLDAQGPAFVALEIIDLNSVWVIGDMRSSGFGPSTVVYRTTNGGDNWDAYTEFWSEAFKSICFSESMYGWLVGDGWEEGLIFATTDGGDNWFGQLSNVPLGLNKVCFTDNNIGYTVGDNGIIIKTTDSGGEWDLLTRGTFNKLNSVYFIDNNTGWTTGGESIILKTTNSGQDWNEQFRLAEGSFMTSIFFIDENRGWVVGGEWGSSFNTKVLKTTNGGIDWIGQSWEGDHLTSVIFIDQLTGWATEDLGKILKTTDGGGYWNEVYDIGNYLGSTFFIDPNLGWAAGEGIYNTTDGGSNWIQQSSAVVHSIFFIDSNYGWAAGREENNNDVPELYRTTNGGIEWIDTNVLPPLGWGVWGWLSSVYFSDMNNGWVVGTMGRPYNYYNGPIPKNIQLILHTTNGGESWTEQSLMTHNSLHSVFFTDNNIGWIVGEGGTILHTTNGGVSFVEEQEINELPMTYNLSNNFPNPFNPSTKIKYSVPQSSIVMIKVFDILGNEIETLVNEDKSTGTYEITWYAEQLPSGVYFYRLKASDFIETKKMLLLK